MTTVNPNDFYEHAGAEVTSTGNIVNPADSVDQNGNQGVNENGRATSYQRILASQTINANSNISSVINVGLGTKAIHAAFKTTAAAQVAIYPCDANGNALSYQSLAISSSTTAQNGAAVVSEYGGSPYVAIFVIDKSGASNTCTFVDVWWTKA